MEAKKQDVNLNIELSVEGRKTHNRWTFTRSNTHVTRSDKVNGQIWVNNHTQFVFARFIYLIFINCAFLWFQIIQPNYAKCFCVLTTGQTDTEIQHHCHWERYGHTVGEYSWNSHDFSSMLFTIQPWKQITALKGPYLSSLRCILCIMLCLKREKMTVMCLISVWRWRNSLTVRFIMFIYIYVFSEYICSQRPHLLVTFNIVLSSLFPVSHPGAIESYLFTIET